MARRPTGDVRRIALSQEGRVQHCTRYGAVDDLIESDPVFKVLIDASVDALTGVLMGEIVFEITVSSLVYFLVMIMPWPMVAAGVPTTTVVMSHLTTVVVR